MWKFDVLFYEMKFIILKFSEEKQQTLFIKHFICPCRPVRLYSEEDKKKKKKGIKIWIKIDKNCTKKCLKSCIVKTKRITNISLNRIYQNVVR